MEQIAPKHQSWLTHRLAVAHGWGVIEAGRTGKRPVVPCAKGGDADDRSQGLAGRTCAEHHEVRLARERGGTASSVRSPLRHGGSRTCRPAGGWRPEKPPGGQAWG